MATILRTCAALLWEECTMAHKKSFEAVDRTMRDLRENNEPTGGALI